MNEQLTRRPATYQDVLDAPPDMVAELVRGALHLHPRPASRHAFAGSTLGAKVVTSFQIGEGGPGGWWIVFEPELHLGEDVLVPAVARHLGRPVKWTETRHEHLLTAAGDRDQAHHARLAVRRDGTIAALETRFTRDHGAYPTLGEAITLNTINHLPGPYRIPSYRAEAQNVVTHKTFIAAYRDYLTAVRDRTAAAKRQGQSLEAAQAALAPALARDFAALQPRSGAPTGRINAAIAAAYREAAN